MWVIESFTERSQVDMTVPVIGPDIVIANDAETVVQQTGGHADLLNIETFTQL
jgi:hypothetical protein